MFPKNRPLGSSEGYNRKRSALKVLLKPQVLIGGDKHLEACLLQLVQQRSIGQSVPSAGFCFFDVVFREEAGEPSRCSVIEKYTHAR